MPFILPPPDYGIPNTEVVKELLTFDREERTKIKFYMNVKPWLCNKCKLLNFGRNEKCADFKCKSPRPVDYRMESYEKI